MSKALAAIKKHYDPPAVTKIAKEDITLIPVQIQEGTKKSPIFYIPKVQFERIRVDMQTWRRAVTEAESAYNPQRVAMQRIFQDTDLNEHVLACKRKRKNLTMLRKFKICDEKGEKNDDLTKLFKKEWFRTFINYSLDSIFYGYNLIGLGDMVDSAFPNITYVRRQNVSPDRLNVVRMPYGMNGEEFLKPPFADWFVYVKTITDTGVSPCGYGLFYALAKTEILIRNNTAQNADYNEVFGQPIRVGKTSKQAEERTVFEQALQTMGSNPYLILDDGQDSVELVGEGSSGTAFRTYEDFEKRCENKITKVLLGHEDALSSVPGKLGAEQGGEESPIADALNGIQSEDGEFIQNIITNTLFPKLRNLGWDIPDGFEFQFENDEEKEAFRKREDESNTATAELFKTIKEAGGELDEDSWKYFSERTGVPVKKSVEPEPSIVMGPDGKPMPGQKALPSKGGIPPKGGPAGPPKPGTPKEEDKAEDPTEESADK